MKIERDLAFKGARRFLHSTTLFDDILLLRGEGVGTVDFEFKKKTTKQVQYRSAAPTSDSELIAIWKDRESTLFVVETEREITRSCPYDEEALVDRLVFTADGVQVPADIRDYSIVEAVVAAFKALLHRTVASHKPKLVFVRVRLSQTPVLPVEVRYSRRIGEFYQGEIRSGGIVAGQIFFGEWK